MAYIDVVAPDEAEGELAAFYERVGQQRGNVARVHQIASLHPPLAETHLDLYMALMYARGGLTRLQRELIATAVSRANECRYCVTHHKEAYARYEKDEAKVEAVAADPESAPLTEEEQALVTYALKLTRTPGQVAEADAGALRRAGFSDEDILAAGAITGYFNFVNRLVLGLGAELEDEEERQYDY